MFFSCAFVGEKSRKFIVFSVDMQRSRYYACKTQYPSRSKLGETRKHSLRPININNVTIHYLAVVFQGTFNETKEEIYQIIYFKFSFDILYTTHGAPYGVRFGRKAIIKLTGRQSKWMRSSKPNENGNVSKINLFSTHSTLVNNSFNNKLLTAARSFLFHLRASGV